MASSVRLQQTAISVLSLATAALFAHWAWFRPMAVSPTRDELDFWPFLLFASTTGAPSRPFVLITLGLMAVTGLAACLLAILLILKTPDRISNRRLAWSLAMGSVACAYLFVLTPHPIYRSLIGWTPTSPVRLGSDFVAYAAGLGSAFMMIRFFSSYPRPLSPEEWAREVELWQQQSIAAANAPNNWRRWVLPARARALLAIKNAKGNLPPLSEMRFFHVLQSRWAIAIVVLWAALAATGDRWAAVRAAAGGATKGALSVLFSMPSVLFIFPPILAWSFVFNSLRIFSRSASPEDRRKVDWIRSTLLVGGMMAIGVQTAGIVAAMFLIPWLGAHDIFLPAQLLWLAPFTLSVQLLTLAFIVALYLSIFYRGALDPRLAARRWTLFGALGAVLAVVFVLIERTLALRVVASLGLPPDTGNLIAFAGVAVLAAPIKKRTEKAINVYMSRWMPLDSMVTGEKKTLVVALTDLSGYTLLSSRDEKQAMLLAALLQRQAARLAEAKGGRVVKSMGDAVLFAFPDPSAAISVLTDLHRGFAPAAKALDLEPLEVHSGAHFGEVTVAHDGDLYGQTVNIASRIQSGAAPGRIVVSEALAQVAPNVGYRELGPQHFRNVPEAINCCELMPAV